VGLPLPVDRKAHPLLFRPSGQKEESKAAGVFQKGPGLHLLPVLEGPEEAGFVGAKGLEGLRREVGGEKEAALLPG
jgi:hypothetical protein